MMEAEANALLVDEGDKQKAPASGAAEVQLKEATKKKTKREKKKVEAKTRSKEAEVLTRDRSKSKTAPRANTNMPAKYVSKVEPAAVAQRNRQPKNDSKSASTGTNLTSESMKIATSVGQDKMDATTQPGAQSVPGPAPISKPKGKRPKSTTPKPGMGESSNSKPNPTQPGVQPVVGPAPVSRKSKAVSTSPQKVTRIEACEPGRCDSNSSSIKQAPKEPGTYATSGPAPVVKPRKLRASTSTHTTSGMGNPEASDLKLSVIVTPGAQSTAGPAPIAKPRGRRPKAAPKEHLAAATKAATVIEPWVGASRSNSTRLHHRSKGIKKNSTATKQKEESAVLEDHIDLELQAATTSCLASVVDATTSLERTDIHEIRNTTPRMNEEAMMDTSDNDRKHENLVEAILVEEPAQSPLITEAVQVNPDEDASRRPIYKHKHFKLVLVGICCLIVVVTVIAAATAAVVGGSSNDSGGSDSGSSENKANSGTTMAPTGESSRYLPMKDYIGNNLVYNASQLEDITSPYYQALRWIVYHDTQQLDSGQADKEKLDQRYIMALLYYSTSQDEPWISCNPTAFNESKGADLGCTHKDYIKQGGSDLDRNDPEYTDEPSTRWGSGASECFWAGVNCGGGAEDGLIDKIDLAYYQMSGTLPPELGFLAMLRKLNLRGNSISGSIPPGLCNAVSLSVLSFSSNALTGVIPSCMGQLDQLREFASEDNSLSGIVPSELGSLTSLERLELKHNELSGTVPFQLCTRTLDKLSVDCRDGDSPRVECSCCRC